MDEDRAKLDLQQMGIRDDRRLLGSAAHHLQNREVLLPEQEPLHPGSHSRQEVVGVHGNVDEAVQETEEGRVASRNVLHAPPDAARESVEQRVKEDGG